MKPSNDYIKNISFEFTDFSSLKFKQITSACNEYNLAIIKNFISQDEISQCKQIIKDKFNQSNDSIRQENEYYKVATNYQRLCVGYGENPGSGEIRNSRLFRILFNPTFQADIYKMHSVFEKLIILRNLLYGVNEKFCLTEPEDGVFSCSRIHQFPKGGGFLQLHKDRDGEITSKDANLTTFLHPLMIFDQKGKDFNTGGGIIKYRDEIIFYEDTLQPGDVAIYNGRTEHGVYNIDKEEILDLNSFNGRSSVLVSLFKNP
tara:strand:- start:1426 stop:2205 length:780 start_codon:yes stop_codon:yes gene_type:complete